MLDLNNFAQEVIDNAVNKGFRTHEHPATRENVAVFVANLHSEVSEFWEAFRNNKLFEPCDKAQKMIEAGVQPLSCAEEELADIFIRAMDTAKTMGIDIERAILLKHQYNTTRPEKHGGKAA